MNQVSIRLIAVWLIGAVGGLVAAGLAGWNTTAGAVAAAGVSMTLGISGAVWVASRDLRK